MSEIQFYVNIANGVAIDIANDILPFSWMEVYPFRVNQSESLLHAKKLSNLAHMLLIETVQILSIFRVLSQGHSGGICN